MKLKFVSSLPALVLFVASAFGQSTLPPPPCSAGAVVKDIGNDGKVLVRGVRSMPRNMVRPHNLMWEVPIGVTTGLLIWKGDRYAVNHIQARSMESTARTWSNIGLDLEMGGAAAGWIFGCTSQHNKAADTGFAALSAMGTALAIDAGLKYAFDREYPYTPGATGRFWQGGHSFPSGHSAVSFAFATVVARRYRHNPWIRWGAYALATGVSLSRYPAKRHYPSDILIGGTLGYIVGTYYSDHAFAAY
jgi:hypothetical protein